MKIENRSRIFDLLMLSYSSDCKIIRDYETNTKELIEFLNKEINLNKY